MEPLIWAVGAVLIGVVAVAVYTVLRLKTAEQWLLEAREQAPAKKLATFEAFLQTMRKEFSTVTEQIDEKHDRWLREQASLRTYIYRRMGKEQKEGESQTSDGIPDRISAADAAQLGVDNGEGTAGSGATQPANDPRSDQRRRIKEAYYAARR